MKNRIHITLLAALLPLVGCRHRDHISIPTNMESAIRYMCEEIKTDDGKTVYFIDGIEGPGISYDSCKAALDDYVKTPVITMPTVDQI